MSEEFILNLCGNRSFVSVNQLLVIGVDLAHVHRSSKLWTDGHVVINVSTEAGRILHASYNDVQPSQADVDTDRHNRRAETYRIQKQPVCNFFDRCVHTNVSTD